MLSKLVGASWWHTDRARSVTAKMLVIPDSEAVLQGLYYLMSEGGSTGAGLWVIPGSHTVDASGGRTLRRHNVQLKTLAEHGLAGKQIKLDIPANSLVLFDSRLVHMGGRSKAYKKRKASGDDPLDDTVAPVSDIGRVAFVELDRARETLLELGFVVLTGVYPKAHREALARKTLLDVQAGCEAAQSVESLAGVTPGMLDGSPVKGMTNGAMCFGAAMWDIRRCAQIKRAFAHIAGYGDQKLVCCLNTVQLCASATDTQRAPPSRLAFGITWLPEHYRSEEQRLNKLAAAALQVKGTTHWAHHAECGTWLYNSHATAKPRPTGQVVKCYKCTFHPVAPTGPWLPDDPAAAAEIQEARQLELQGPVRKYGDGHLAMRTKGVAWLERHLPVWMAQAM
jgi:hypothetical protein